MFPIVDRGVDSPLNGKLGDGVTDQQIAGAAYTVFLFHPLTWVLVYFFLEGAVRLCGAAFAEKRARHAAARSDDRALARSRLERTRRPVFTDQRNTQSSVALRERTMLSRLKQVPDELHYAVDQTQELRSGQAAAKTTGSPPKWSAWTTSTIDWKRTPSSTALALFAIVCAASNAVFLGRNVLPQESKTQS